MNLPKKNEEVSLPKIKEICEFFGLHDLWRKIETDPPPRPFKSDGCSVWFDSWKGFSLYPACFLHDLILGGLSLRRRRAIGCRRRVDDSCCPPAG